MIVLELVVPVWPIGSNLVVHFVTFSNTSSPPAFFLGVRVISQVSVTRPAALQELISKTGRERSIGWTHVSVVVVVVTEVEPPAWRALSGRAWTWAEKRRKKERKTKNVDWDGMVSVRRNA